MHFCNPTEDKSIWMISERILSTAVKNRRNGENCALREMSLSMNLTSAIGISTYTTAKIFMCLLA